MLIGRSRKAMISLLVTDNALCGFAYSISDDRNVFIVFLAIDRSKRRKNFYIKNGFKESAIIQGRLSRERTGRENDKALLFRPILIKKEKRYSNDSISKTLVFT